MQNLLSNAFWITIFYKQKVTRDSPKICPWWATEPNNQEYVRVSTSRVSEANCNTSFTFLLKVSMCMCNCRWLLTCMTLYLISLLNNLVNSSLHLLTVYVYINSVMVLPPCVWLLQAGWVYQGFLHFWPGSQWPCSISWTGELVGNVKAWLFFPFCDVAESGCGWLWSGVWGSFGEV